MSYNLEVGWFTIVNFRISARSWFVFAFRTILNKAHNKTLEQTGKKICKHGTTIPYLHRISRFEECNGLIDNGNDCLGKCAEYS